jgi:hypothetical protein
MLRSIQTLLAVLMLAGGLQTGRAFSLLGPFEAWQVSAIGHNLGGDIGGPMNIGEEYRWNIKTLYFGFDESFLNYFGTAGTNAVFQAVSIMNGIPAASQMSANLAEFPLDVTRVNFQASALGLLDLKSFTLSTLVEHMGLAEAERYVWTLRNRRTFTVGGQDFTNYTVIQRNFDPVTHAPTPYVNGVLYTYEIVPFTNPQVDDAIETQVDPLAIGFSSVSLGSVGVGEFYIGLTRDDVGGLRYLYRTNNFNTELLNAATILTPTVTSNPPPLGSPANTPWTITTNTVVSQGLRPGVDKVNFQFAAHDSLLGVFVTFTNTATDTIVTNGVATNQTILRVITAPDILFGAADLGLVGDFPILSTRTTTANWDNNDPINGQTALAGPGVIQSPVVITFSKLGPYFINSNPSFIDESTAFRGTLWGSFDGSTNPPVVFPDFISIQELENQVLFGQ